MTKRRGALAIAVTILVVALGPFVLFRACRASNAITPHAVDSDRAARERELKVLTWNLAHCRGDGADAKNTGQTLEERRARLDQIVAQVREADADVVVLNEVDFDTIWSGHFDQARAIAERAGYAHVVTQRNLDVVFPFARWRFGNAILSRAPLDDARLVKHPPFKPWEDVLAGNHDSLRATLVHPTFGTIDIWAVHLESRDEATRVIAAEQILSLLGTRALLAGDFNSTPTRFRKHNTNAAGQNALELFEAELNVPAASFTFPSRAPNRTIDWVMARGLTPAKPEVLCAPLSDHCAVTVSWTLDAPR